MSRRAAARDGKENEEVRKKRERAEEEISFLHR